jgi:transketolase
VQSNGPASMLLYALLHLAGVEAFNADGVPLGRPAVSLDDIKRFRALGGACPGHPEHGHTTGLETTTGPLGQGVGASVGMAIAERWLAQRFNRPVYRLSGYSVYAVYSDSDLMEGISGEAASLAGHPMLSNQCWIYDDNCVSTEGGTVLAFSEDVAARFEGYGWATISVDDANDCDAFARAVEAFQATDDRPTLIRVRSVIGNGSPYKQGASKIHRDPLGPDEARATMRTYGWPEEAQFLVPDWVRARLDASLGARGGQLSGDWAAMLDRYTEAHPEAARDLRAMQAGAAPADWDKNIPVFPADAKGMASREASGKVLNAIAPHWPWLVGGAADLSPSTKTHLDFDGAGGFEPGADGGRNLQFGVREHVMGAVSNGLALTGLRPYTGTFLVFSDYKRAPLRLAAIMRLPAVFIFSHDSIGLGQDGPTDQPVETLAGLRAISGMVELRPGDANEAAEAWRTIRARRDGSSCLILSRQSLPTLDRSRFAPAGVARGAYVLAEPADGSPEVILIGTGSELPLCVAAHEQLAAEGVSARIVSMQSCELFEARDAAYRAAVLPAAMRAWVAVEAASPLGWDRFVGLSGAVIAMPSFGASDPIDALMRYFGFSAEAVVWAARAQIAGGTAEHDRGPAKP